MALFFSGTSTGNMYKAGQTYQTGAGEKYRANSDGSFTNLRSQVTLKGSSRDASTVWARSGSSSKAPAAISGGGSGAGSERVVSANAQSPATAGGSGPGGSGYVISEPVRRASGGVLTFGSSKMYAPNAALIPKNGELKRIGDGRGQEAHGAISDIGWVRTDTGWQSVPSADVKERIEDDLYQEISWMWRNKILPDMMLKPQPFPDFLNRDDVFYHPIHGEWQPKQNSIWFRKKRDGYVTGGGF